MGGMIKRNWISSEEFWRGLEKISYFILFPATLFNFIHNANFQLNTIINLITVLILSTILVGGMMILYKSRNTHLTGKQFTSMFQGSIRYNSYFFFSISSTVLTNEGMSIVSAVAAVMMIVTNLLVIGVFYTYVKDTTRNQHWTIYLSRTIITNPLIIASFLGIFCNIVDIHLTFSLQNTLNLVAGAAFPIGALIIGASLKLSFKNNNEVQNLVIVSLSKLLVLPVVTIFGMYMFNIHGIPKIVGIIYSALPTASNSYVLSRQLGGDSSMMSNIISINTCLSLIPLLILLNIVL